MARAQNELGGTGGEGGAGEGGRERRVNGDAGWAVDLEGCEKLVHPTPPG